MNSRIKELLKEDRPTASIIQKALEQEQAEKEAREIAAVRSNLRHARNVLDNAVRNLRNLRQREKEARKQVQKVDEAFQKFQEDGDFDAFCRNI